MGGVASDGTREFWDTARNCMFRDWAEWSRVTRPVPLAEVRPLEMCREGARALVTQNARWPLLDDGRGPLRYASVSALLPIDHCVPQMPRIREPRSGG